MPNTDEQNEQLLLEIRDNLIVRIGEVTSSPKPTYNIDGQEVKWTEYLAMLIKQKTAIDSQLIIIQGPFEIESQGYC